AGQSAVKRGSNARYSHAMATRQPMKAVPRDNRFDMLIRCFLVVVVATLFAMPASAADDVFCQNYASVATRDASAQSDAAGALILGIIFGAPPPFGPLNPRGALADSCGYSGPRWTTNSDDHYNWCRGTDETTVNAEEAARLADLRYCNMCASYTNAAADL